MPAPASTATSTTASTATEHREPEKPAKPQLVVVELARQRTTQQIKRLRRGEGKLVADIEEVLRELTGTGTIKADSQPVVLVVREAAALPWPLNADVDDDDDDD